MNVSRRTVALFGLGLGLLFALPFAARAWRGPGPDRCAFDGQAIVDAEAVHVDFTASSGADFCSVGCARGWLDRADRVPVRVTVHDERTGRELDARDAHFVRSRVPTATVTRVPIHVFADAADAHRHAEQHRGRVLDGLRHPFHPRPPVSNSPDSTKHEERP